MTFPQVRAIKVNTSLLPFERDHMISRSKHQHHPIQKQMTLRKISYNEMSMCIEKFHASE